MQQPTRQELARSGSLEELYGKLARLGMVPGWNKSTPSLWPSPRKTLVPAHWTYDQARGALDAAGRLINTELAERRNLIMFNPGDANCYGTVRTLVAAYQMIMPGEWARAHRHTPNALRLILDAEPGTYTVVDGIKYAMEPGDELLTPNWSSHGHGNDSRASAYWLDFLDVPLVQLLEPMFFESLEEEDEQHEAFKGEAPKPSQPAQFVFSAADTARRLIETAPDPGGPFGTQIQLGEPALDTMALYMMQLAPRTKTASYKSTANNIFAVVRGTGTTTIDGERFKWSRGDVIAAPAWQPHFHEADDDALLFRVTDEPVLTRLGFHRVDDLAAGTAH
jgi:gentisate 1,2-dioxygenase